MTYQWNITKDLLRLSMTQQILTVALARTIEFNSTSAYSYTYNMTPINMNKASHVMNATTNPTVLTKRQRRRLREKKAKLSATKAAAKNGKVTKSTSSTTTRKATTTSSNATTKMDTPAKLISASNNNEQQPAINKESTEGMLYELAIEFRSNIGSLQKLFDSELKDNSKAALERQPTVAEITLTNGSLITSEAFQYMRSIILTSVEQLQKSKRAIPIFYSWTNNRTYINVLCENQYAYNFLKDCVERMTTVGSVSLYPLEPSASRLYCYSAIYKGIVHDVTQFLLQIRLQVPKMRTDRWIVTSSKVCETEQNETQFLFLVDELSALMLEHKYGDRFFINLSELLFHNHGQLPSFA